jgi:hypothetical protein
VLGNSPKIFFVGLLQVFHRNSVMLLQSFNHNRNSFRGRMDVSHGHGDRTVSHELLNGEGFGPCFAKPCFVTVAHMSMKKREKKKEWNIYPDERLDIDWSTIHECLNCVAARREEVLNPLFGSFFADPHYVIRKFSQVKSHEKACCQVADLFAGISVYSIHSYERYNAWIKAKHTPLTLFGRIDAPELTNSEDDRFKIMQFLNDGCKKRRLGVSLTSNRCFYTFDPQNPINFWHYKPQHEDEKAPTKGT